MSLESLLTGRRLRRHRPTAKEIADQLGIADRDLAAARDMELVADLRFAIAYGAAVALATIALTAAGYRTVGAGHHQTLFEALPDILGEESRARANYLDDCRSKRNETEYVRAGGISRQEAADLLTEAKAFRDDVLGWLRASHPELAPE